MSTEYSQLMLKQHDDVLVATLLSRQLIDGDQVEDLSIELQAVVAEKNPAKFLINFDRVVRCSTQVINTVLVAKKRLLSEGGDLKICGMSDSIRHTYRILNLDGTVFHIVDSVEDGVNSF